MCFIQLFNKARADYEWGKPALFGMVEIYLNIDSDLGWDKANSEECLGPSEETIETMQKLLNESRQASINPLRMPPATGPMKCHKRLHFITTNHYIMYVINAFPWEWSLK